MELVLSSLAGALAGLLDLLLRLAVPLAVVLSALLLAAALLYRRDRERFAFLVPAGPAVFRSIARLAATTLLLLGGWGLLSAALPAVRQSLEWRESAEAVANPAPDAPPVYQFGPSLAAVVERTYVRSITLPPSLLRRVGEDGLGVLAPYLADPSTENVLRLADRLRRTGRETVLTREVTRMDEDPRPFESAEVTVRFQRLAERAYDAWFEGRFRLAGSSDRPETVRFVFPLPQAGTVRELQVRVGEQDVSEPGAGGTCEWRGTLGPGESREAVVRYRVTGAGTWHFALGSERRRVKHLVLTVQSTGPLRFLRGSLQPTSTGRDQSAWELRDVVTGQQVGLSFPADRIERETYLQALLSLPWSFGAGAGAIVLLGWFGWAAAARRLGALAAFAAGLVAAPVLAAYVGPLVALLVAPLCGGIGAGLLLGRRWLWVTALTALAPATFLSAHHTGLLLLVLGLIAAAGTALAGGREVRGAGTPERI